MKDNKKLLERFNSKINYPSKVNKNCEDFFNKLKIERKSSKIQKLNNSISYESKSERMVLEKLLKIESVNKIKTQSLKLEYEYNEKKGYFYPDFVILMKDGSIIILEVKNELKMVDTRAIYKYTALKEFAIKNGFGYGMVTKDFITFEHIVSAKKNVKLETELIENLKEKRLIKWKYIQEIKNKFNCTSRDIEKILYDNIDKLEFKFKKMEINLRQVM